MVDFTAKWCVNCIVNYNVALNTEPTRQLLEELDAVPMLADWTDRSATIKKKLQELESRSIPLLAIYPGSDPDKPIVLRDLVSQTAVLDALREAGESVSGSSTAGSSTAGRGEPAANSSSGRVAVVHSRVWDFADTIVAIASPTTPAPRGIVRISGPAAVDLLAAAECPGPSQPHGARCRG